MCFINQDAFFWLQGTEKATQTDFISMKSYYTTGSQEVELQGGITQQMEMFK